MMGIASRPTWACELKSTGVCAAHMDNVSRPTWACELKSEKFKAMSLDEVTPHVGV